MLEAELEDDELAQYLTDLFKADTLMPVHAEVTCVGHRDCNSAPIRFQTDDAKIANPVESLTGVSHMWRGLWFPLGSLWKVLENSGTNCCFIKRGLGDNLLMV